MRYFHSQHNFKRYRPYRSRWERLRDRLRKKSGRQTACANEMRVWNPHARKQQSGISKKFVVFFVILPGTIIAWAALLLYLPYFTISKISLNGLKIIKNEQLEADIRTNILSGPRYLARANFFMTSERKITNYLNEHYALNSVSVKKIFPRTLQIDIEEKISSVIYDNGRFYYLLGEDGMIIKTLRPVGDDEFIAATVQNASTTKDVATTTTKTHLPAYKIITKEFGEFPIIYDLREPTTTEKNFAIAKEMVAGTIAWQGGMEKRGIGKVKYCILENPRSGLKAKTTLGYDIYFQPDEDIDIQLANLQAVLRENHPVEYVDLRYEGRVYWK